MNKSSTLELAARPTQGFSGYFVFWLVVGECFCLQVLRLITAFFCCGTHGAYCRVELACPNTPQTVPRPQRPNVQVHQQPVLATPALGTAFTYSTHLLSLDLSHCRNEISVHRHSECDGLDCLKRDLGLR
ncbi:hypothetical protein DPX16_11899 [Anabarilius grahami]|uniref:Uncharacterized protein n=1 Tax=Anabarilius grahami TaxID=495550 RepID=A0A3N0YCC0_ANAGA|nr:hypothetical protein DPX16_11899 [Anabarilius grahami]